MDTDQIGLIVGLTISVLLLICIISFMCICRRPTDDHRSDLIEEGGCQDSCITFCDEYICYFCSLRSVLASPNRWKYIITASHHGNRTPGLKGSSGAASQGMISTGGVSTDEDWELGGYEMQSGPSSGYQKVKRKNSGTSTPLNSKSSGDNNGIGTDLNRFSIDEMDSPGVGVMSPMVITGREQSHDSSHPNRGNRVIADIVETNNDNVTGDSSRAQL